MRLALRMPYRDGTTHVIFEPEDFLARLVALVPKPRAQLTRYHGVFAPASPSIRQTRVGHRRSAISWSDRFVILINTRATGRDGRVLTRDGERLNFK